MSRFPAKRSFSPMLCDSSRPCIKNALAHGVSRLVLVVGGSASSDGGAGLLIALGARFLDTNGRPIAPGASGIAEAVEFDRSALADYPSDGVVALTDVTAPLLGDDGAAAVYAPQKGATPADVRTIEAALTNWAGLVGVDPALPGVGAAGGAAYGLVAWGGDLVSGAEAIADIIELPELLENCDLVITGEGSFDGQSTQGKAPSVIARLAASAHVPVSRIAHRGTHLALPRRFPRRNIPDRTIWLYGCCYVRPDQVAQRGRPSP